MKIAIFVTCLGKGGVERVAALQSKILSSLGHEVHVITLLNTNFHKVHGVHFSLEKKKQLYKKNIFHRLGKIVKARNYIKDNKIDLVIDNRPRNLFYRDFLFNHYVYNKIFKIFVVHNSKLDIYFSVNNLFFNFLYSSNDIFVTVSKGVEISVKCFFKKANVITIYNPIPKFSDDTKIIELPRRYILFLGRLHNDQKNLKLLLEAYKTSKLSENNVKLLMVGDGDDGNLINEKIKTLDLEGYVVRKSFNPNPKRYIENAICTVLTSNYEGFGMVLVESLSLSTPVISVDCNSGPSEIIIQNVNGLLVPNHDFNALAKAMNTIVEKPELIKIWKENAKESVEKFSNKKITKKWEGLLNSINVFEKKQP